ncbi:unnamed protein product, partial [Ectocarpus sp. 13 AM-2016]
LSTVSFQDHLPDREGCGYPRPSVRTASGHNQNTVTKWNEEAPHLAGRVISAREVTQRAHASCGYMKSATEWTIDILLVAGSTLYTVTALCCIW